MATRQGNPYTWMEKLLVIGIDIGTTHSGVSYALHEPGKALRVQPVTRFSGQREDTGKSKVRSVVCYDQNRNVIAVGHQTDPEVNATPFEGEDIRRAEWFKLQLWPPRLAAKIQLETLFSYPEPTENKGENGELLGLGRTEREKIGGSKKRETRGIPSREIVERSNKKNLPRPVTNDFRTPIGVYTDLLEYLFTSAKEHIIETERNIDPTFSWSLIENNTYFVLTHPNVWEKEQQSQIRRAAVAAGLVNISAPACRITFVTEGEASLYFCLGKNPELRQERDGILVVDCGGGTIDLSAYSQGERGIFKKIAPLGLLQGSIFITSRARDYFKERFKNSKYGSSTDVETMARAFDKPEGVKCLFQYSDRPYFVKFANLRANDQKYSICGGKFKVEGEQMAKLFDPAVQGIISGIMNQCSNAKDGIKYVLLVGGLGRSEYLFEKLNDHFNHSEVTILRPDITHPNKAAADGAVLWYLDRCISTHGNGAMTRHLSGPANPNTIGYGRTKIVQDEEKSNVPGVLTIALKLVNRITPAVLDSKVSKEKQLCQAHESTPQSTRLTTVNNRGQVLDEVFTLFSHNAPTVQQLVHAQHNCQEQPSITRAADRKCERASDGSSLQVQRETYHCQELVKGDISMSIQKSDCRDLGMNELGTGKLKMARATEGLEERLDQLDRKKIEGKLANLDPRTQKLSNAEHTTQEQRKEDTKKPAAEIFHRYRLLRGKVTELSCALSKQIRELKTEITLLDRCKPHSSEGIDQIRDRKSGNNHRTVTGDDITGEKQLHGLSPSVGKSVVESIGALNALIEIASGLLSDSSLYRERLVLSKELLDEVEPSYNDIHKKTNNLDIGHNSDYLTMQIALQSGLIKGCSYIVNNGTSAYNGATHNQTLREMMRIDQEDADAWKMQPRVYNANSETNSVTGMDKLTITPHTQVEQAYRFVADSLSYQLLLISGNKLKDALDELVSYTELRLYNLLRDKSTNYKTKSIPSIIRIALQSALVNACSYFIGDWLTASSGAKVSNPNQADPATGKSNIFDNTPPQSKIREINRDYLAGSAMTAVGDSDRGGILSPRLDGVLKEIFKAYLDLQKVISEDVVSVMGLTTDTISNDDKIDSATEDTEGGAAKIGPSSVICTMERIESDSLIMQIILQSELVNASHDIIDNGNPLTGRMAFPGALSGTVKVGQTKASFLTTQLYTRAATILPGKSWQINWSYLAETAHKLMIIVVRGSVENRGYLPPRYNEELKAIIQASLKPHNIVSEETYTISCEFGPSRMKDKEAEVNEIRSGKVDCTLEVGLQHMKKKVDSKSGTWL